MATKKKKTTKKKVAKKKVAKKASGDPKPSKKDPKTPNGQMIHNLMLKRNVEGTYKDFVVIAGNKMIDWVGSFELFTVDGSPFGADGVGLIHKSKLENVVGKETAAQFWRMGRRIAPTQEQRNQNAIRHRNN